MNAGWAGYERVHSNRANLLIHLFAVPLFAASFVLVILYLLRQNFLAAALALALCVLAMLAQKSGHGREQHAPQPFAGPGDFAKRWFSEQFFRFPVFVVSGRWWQQYCESAEKSAD